MDSKNNFIMNFLVEKSEDPKEITIGYKNSRLIWHPNLNFINDTTKKFYIIIETYQCLNDP